MNALGILSAVELVLERVVIERSSTRKSSSISSNSSISGDVGPSRLKMITAFEFNGGCTVRFLPC